MRVDAHHHLWRYEAAEFGWIEDEAAALRRDFLPAELEAEMDRAGVDRAVAVQARCSVEETRFLLRCAAESERIARVVGWVPLTDAGVGAVLDQVVAEGWELAGGTQGQRPGDGGLAGVREVAQDQPEGFLLRPEFNRGVRELTRRGLTYDVLVRARQMEEAIRFVDGHPQQRFVLDHGGKPEIAAGHMEPWRSQMRELARRENVLCKLSGLVTEADWRGWTEEEIGRYLDVCVEAFGPGRVMAGSDWPVCLVASGYAQWWGLLDRWAGRFSEGERAAMLGGTAAEFYGVR